MATGGAAGWVHFGTLRLPPRGGVAHEHHSEPRPRLCGQQQHQPAGAEWAVRDTTPGHFPNRPGPISQRVHVVFAPWTGTRSPMPFTLNIDPCCPCHHRTMAECVHDAFAFAPRVLSREARTRPAHVTSTPDSPLSRASSSPRQTTASSTTRTKTGR